ncbi:MAG: O-succinylbenzoic acid--CoA ligase [Runella slithyformis]|nr:MAG: O-succinylbenzoic acid--CoA ligase [Runella slithyformis]TAF29436.1 MAG: O-succinylbenzoic acid--CoA ligase [Runella slithyformis]TAF48185.1 MAG: O-succinylbenzoic acid--CoA ligase [Runella slithyformis]TAF81655.1 MAG: O-succinylbenzoic acid--CoA ligase [Runella slithyformis]
MASFYPINPQQLNDSPPPSSDYFALALDFCRAWAAGQQTFVRQTSGSTGNPKSIEINRNQLQHSAKITQQALQLQQGQTALVCLNVAFIAGTMMLVRGMEMGLNMYVVMPSSNPLEDIPADVAVDFAAFVPLQMQTMLQNGLASRLNTFQKIIVGGAAVSESLLAQIALLQVPVFSTYGMTETVSHVALRRLNGLHKSESYALLPNIEANTDERGCLRLRGAVTNQAWIQTNDLIQFIDNQNFIIIGRADNIINSGGVKIQLEKVEKAIEQVWREQPRFFAWHQLDKTLGQKLILIIETTAPADSNLAIKTLKVQLLPHLTNYEIPKQIYYIEKFIETPTGKIDKRATFEAANQLL